MITIYKVEEFVVNQLFRPYATEFIEADIYSMEFKRVQKAIETKLHKRPEYIIEILEDRPPEVRERIFDRLRRIGPLRFYRYLDKNTEILRYIEKEYSKNQQTQTCETRR